MMKTEEGPFNIGRARTTCAARVNHISELQLKLNFLDSNTTELLQLHNLYHNATITSSSRHGALNPAHSNEALFLPLVALPPSTTSMDACPIYHRDNCEQPLRRSKNLTNHLRAADGGHVCNLATVRSSRPTNPHSRHLLQAPPGAHHLPQRRGERHPFRLHRRAAPLPRI